MRPAAPVPLGLQPNPSPDIGTTHIVPTPPSHRAEPEQVELRGRPEILAARPVLASGPINIAPHSTGAAPADIEAIDPRAPQPVSAHPAEGSPVRSSALITAAPAREMPANPLDDRAAPRVMAEVLAQPAASIVAGTLRRNSAPPTAGDRTLPVTRGRTEARTERHEASPANAVERSTPSTLQSQSAPSAARSPAPSSDPSSAHFPAAPPAPSSDAQALTPQSQSPAPQPPAASVIAPAPVAQPITAPAPLSPDGSARPDGLSQLETTVNQLVQSRESGRALRPELTVRHQEFGAVRMQLDASGQDLRATIASRDPGFVPAIQAALAERAGLQSAETGQSQNQRGSDQSGNSTANGQNAAGQQSQSDGRYGSSTGSGQASPQPYRGQDGAQEEDHAAHGSGASAKTGASGSAGGDVFA